MTERSCDSASAQAASAAGPSTGPIVDALYDAFLRGDADGMLALFADDISLRFLGQADLAGIADARRFFAFAAGLLADVDFRIERKIIDGEWAAVVWNESARTASGEPWENHGVDVIRVVGERVTVLHENNDVRLVARYFPPFGRLLEDAAAPEAPPGSQVVGQDRQDQPADQGTGQQ